VVCGLGAYLPLVISLVLMALLLGLGGYIDDAVHGWRRRTDDSEAERRKKSGGPR
jgi:hypothetical protein